MIRGGTPHFDYVAGEAAKGVAQAMLETGSPIAFGVITTDTRDIHPRRWGKPTEIVQALERRHHTADRRVHALDQASVDRLVLRLTHRRGPVDQARQHLLGRRARRGCGFEGAHRAHEDGEEQQAQQADGHGLVVQVVDVVEEQRRRVGQAVNLIENPSMTRDKIARVFDSASFKLFSVCF